MTIDDGGKNEGTQLRLIHAVHQHTRCLRRRRHELINLSIVGGRYHQSQFGIYVGRLERCLLNRQLPCLTQLGNLNTDLGGNNVHLCLRSQQPADLAHRSGPGADNQTRGTTQVVKQRQVELPAGCFLAAH